MKLLTIALLGLISTSAIAANPGTVNQKELAGVLARLTALENAASGDSGLGTNYKSTCNDSGGSCLIFPSFTQVNGAMEVLSLNPFNISPPAPGTGLDAADFICKTEGDNRYGPGHTWKALISSSTRDASSLIDSSKNYINYFGSLASVGNQLFMPAPDQYQGVLIAPFSLGVNSPTIWTGSTTLGENSGSNCNDWTSSSDSVDGTYGFSATSSTWISSITDSCDARNGRGLALYCIEQEGS